MLYQITETKYPEVEGAYGQSLQELRDFFEFNWNRNYPKLFLVPDRKTIDSL